MPRYQIAQDAASGVWIIVSAKDQALLWCGSHWGYQDQRSGPLISFTSEAAAENYARQILGEAE